MKFWTTFTPQKVSWELTNIASKGKKADSHWRNHLPLIRRSLTLLHDAGIYGIRLVILPDELTNDGKTIDWQPIEMMLDMCKRAKLAVDLCIGPLQYPNYPGIYIPQSLLQYVSGPVAQLDSIKPIADYATSFLKQELSRYGNDPRVTGFHFANEWPDKQGIKGKEAIKGAIAKDFMLEMAKSIVSATKKPIALNTNIDASEKHRLDEAFSEVLGILGPQAKLGFDIYASQESWTKTFLQKLRRLFEPYPVSFAWSCKTFSSCEIFFCEVESQPWGAGQSWYTMINDEADAQKRVLLYTKETMRNTYEKYLKPSKPHDVSLWGADFWLAANAMHIDWPLANVKKIARRYR